jgi:hypothetical protein
VDTQDLADRWHVRTIQDEHHVVPGRRLVARAWGRNLQPAGVSREGQPLEALPLVEGMGDGAEPNQAYVGDLRGVGRVEPEGIAIR